MVLYHKPTGSKRHAREGLDLTIDQRSAVPLYEQICQQIRQKVESRQLKPGTVLPTGQSLSAQLQINFKTAHQAMATLAKEGYVMRQARRGTIVKGVPRRGVVAIYAYAHLIRQDDTHEYYRLITSHLMQQLEQSGRTHRLYLGNEEGQTPNIADEDLLRHLTDGTLSGMLLVNTPPHRNKLVRQGRLLHVPVVALSGYDEVDYSIRVDYPGYVRGAAEYLRRQGRRRVGVIYKSSSPLFADPTVITRILKGRGYAPKAKWIVGCVETEKGGYEAASKAPLDELDGLIVEDDVMALGVDRRLCELGVRVPDDLLVTTHWSRGSRLRLTLPFERFEMDVAKQASTGLQMMQDAIHGRRIAEPHLRIVPTRFNQNPQVLPGGCDSELIAPIGQV